MEIHQQQAQSRSIHRGSDGWYVRSARGSDGPLPSIEAAERYRRVLDKVSAAGVVLAPLDSEGI
jgi:hypothetical protein